MQQKYISAVQIILSEQRQIIGPLAIDLAKQVDGLIFKSDSEMEFNKDPKQALQNLVLKYQNVFGRTSVEVCKKALRRTNLGFDTNELPEILQK